MHFIHILEGLSQNWWPKLGCYRYFQYVINNIVHCNNLLFLHYFHHGRKKPLKGLRVSKNHNMNNYFCKKESFICSKVNAQK